MGNSSVEGFLWTFETMNVIALIELDFVGL